MSPMSEFISDLSDQIALVFLVCVDQPEGKRGGDTPDQRLECGIIEERRPWASIDTLD